MTEDRPEIKDGTIDGKFSEESGLDPDPVFPGFGAKIAKILGSGCDQNLIRNSS